MVGSESTEEMADSTDIANRRLTKKSAANATKRKKKMDGPTRLTFLVACVCVGVISCTLWNVSQTKTGRIVRHLVLTSAAAAAAPRKVNVRCWPGAASVKPPACQSSEADFDSPSTASPPTPFLLSPLLPVFLLLSTASCSRGLTHLECMYRRNMKQR